MTCHSLVTTASRQWWILVPAAHALPHSVHIAELMVPEERLHPSCNRHPDVFGDETPWGREALSIRVKNAD